jgi:uncharacterized protein YjiS (DUF1127 family)
MTPEALILTTALDLRGRYRNDIDDRLLADIGMTREQLARQQRWFRRKSR